MISDIVYALRGLRRNPGFAAVAILTLTLGIGANTAVFSLVRAVFFAPLPFEEADRLVSLREQRPTSRDANLPVSGHEYAAWKERNDVFESIALFRAGAANLTGAGDPEVVRIVWTSAEYLPLLRMPPGVGRLFAPGEVGPGAARVSILSDAFWRRRFSASPGVIGRSITLDRQDYTIVGVLPPLPPSLTTDVLLPLDVAAQVRAVGRHNLSVIARLRPGVTVEQAQANLRTIAGQIARERPDSNSGHEVLVRPLREDLVGQFRAALVVLLAAVGFLLLIGCVNVANLLLARGANRQTEIAIRMALGASNARVIRQLLVESLLLAVLGGAAGLLIAVWIMDLAPAISAVDIPLIETARLDWLVLGVTAIVSLVAGLAAGIAPALRVSRAAPDGLRDGGRISDDRGRHSLRSMLVASEAALTLILLVGAGLMIASFVKLVSVDPGFSESDRLVVPVDLPGSTYPEPVDRRAFYDRLLERLQAIPGVEAAGAVSNLPLGGSDNWMAFTIGDRPAPGPGHEPNAAFRMVTPDYFRAMGIPLKSGRLFRAGDARASLPLIRWYPQQPYPQGFDAPQPAPVAIVSEAAARRFWPGEDPTGKRIRVLFSPEVTIVGVVGDIRHNALDAPITPHIYLPHNQEPWNSVSIVVRTAGASLPVAPAVRAQIRAIDPAIPITVKTMKDVVNASVDRPRFYAMLIGVFGVVALGLALVGIFGVVSYVAARRTREIGVRLALGARPREIMALVVGQGMHPVAAGTIVGIAGALALTRLIRNLLYGVAPSDPMILAASVLLLMAVGLIACWIPARRATRVDPLTALRAE